MVPMQKNWKSALAMLWSMQILNVAAQFRLASKELMQNDTIYDPLSSVKIVLHAPSDSSIPSMSYFLFCSNLRGPISCSLLGGVIPTQNSGYGYTRLCLSSV